MSYSFKEMVDMLWVCRAADSNARKALRIYTEKISLRRHSHYTMFASIDRTIDLEEEILDRFEQEPNGSTRSLANEGG
jgi:hypothetical protein